MSVWSGRRRAGWDVHLAVVTDICYFSTRLDYVRWRTRNRSVPSPDNCRPIIGMCKTFSFLNVISNVFIVLMLIICVTSTMLILVRHCLWLMILFTVNLEIFVICDVFSKFYFLCGMIRFLNLFYSVCLCLSFILSVLVTNKRTYRYLTNNESIGKTMHILHVLLQKTLSKCCSHSYEENKIKWTNNQKNHQGVALFCQMNLLHKS